MANQYATPTPAPATQVGSYFVQQYYQMFQQSRDYVHQFYNDSSSMMRIDGDVSESASDMMQIHQLIMSLNFTGIEIKTIKSLESWSGGVLVVVSGIAKSRKFVGLRKFVQTFFLAPQENGYFVLNDMFHFVDEEPVQQPSVHLPQEDAVDYHQTVPTQLPDQTASGYPLEEEAVGYLNSVHISGNEPDVDYSYQDHQQKFEPESEPEPEPEFEAEPEDYRYEDEAPFEDSNVLLQSTVTPSPEPQPSVAEPVGEPEKLTYASILRAKGKAPAPTLVTSTVFSQKAAPAPSSDWNDGWNNDSQPSLPQSTPSILQSGFETVEDASSFEGGESLSVYVRNLPSYLTVADVEEEFSYYGKIKNDGIFLKSRTDTGVCYAFVEYEDVEGVQTAIRASPIMLHGRNVYVEERRQNPGATRGGGRMGRGGGRGRGVGRGRGFGRSDQNGGYNNNSNRGRSNGFRTS